MLIRNRATGKIHETTKKGWEALGKNQNLFTVVDNTDNEPQRVTNVLPQAKEVADKPVIKEPVKNQPRPTTGDENKKSSTKTRK